MFLTETQYKKVLLWTTLIGVMFYSLKGVEIKFVSLVVEIVFRCIVYSFFLAVSLYLFWARLSVTVTQ